jgi:hypothetical protein
MPTELEQRAQERGAAWIAVIPERSSMVGSLSSPERRTTTRLAWLIAELGAALIVALAVVACGEEPEEKKVAAAAPEPPVAIYQLEHLNVTDHILPEHWLASRQAGQDLSRDDPRVAAMGKTLEVAGRRFRDYPRMIANRAVQLEEMLEEKNMPQAAPQLIELLLGVPEEARYVESFGALCQQYYNLRMQGLEPQEAVRALKGNGYASRERHEPGPVE